MRVRPTIGTASSKVASLPPGSRGAMRLCVNRRSFRHRNGDGCRFGAGSGSSSNAASGSAPQMPPPLGRRLRPARGGKPRRIAAAARRAIANPTRAPHPQLNRHGAKTPHRRSHQHPSEIAAEPPSTDFFRSLLGGQAGLWDAAAFSTRNRASWRASMLRSEEQRSVTVSECAPGRYGRRHSMGWRCSKWRGAGRRR